MRFSRVTELCGMCKRDKERMNEVKCIDRSSSKTDVNNESNSAKKTRPHGHSKCSRIRIREHINFHIGQTIEQRARECHCRPSVLFECVLRIFAETYSVFYIV